VKRRLLFLVTEDWYFWSHRISIAVAARQAGFDVTVATRVHEHRERIEEKGVAVVPLSLRRSSCNVLGELRAIIELTRVYRRVRPGVVHHVGMKPVIYGSIAALFAGRPAVVNAISGFGHVADDAGKGRLVKAVVWRFYRLAFALAPRLRVIVQNPENLDVLLNELALAREKAVLIRGVGADLQRFAHRPEPQGVPVLMTAGRLLWNKGSSELVEAAAFLREHGQENRVVIVGAPDTESPKAIPQEVLRQWEREGKAEWWGHRDDMENVLAQTNVVVLHTTYGEGVPKILIESAAVGRAAIATDVPGCREIITHGDNGLLVPPGDLEALKVAIETLVGDDILRRRMGQRAREIAEAEFSESESVARTLSVYDELLPEATTASPDSVQLNGKTHGPGR